MRVTNRIFLTAVLLSVCLMSYGQLPSSKLRFPAHPDSIRANAKKLKPVIVYTTPKALVFKTTGSNNGAKGITAISIPNANHQFIGRPKAIKVNGPVQSGYPIVVSGNTLMQSSVNVDIVNELGESIVYKESEVKLNEEQNELRIDVKLPAGIYKLSIPVADGITNKTVIVQEPYAGSWNIKKN